MSSRKLFLFSPGAESQTIAHQLKPLEWQIFTASDIVSARNLIKDHDFHIGLVYLNNPEAVNAGKLEELLLTNRSLEWIAVVSSLNRQSTVLGKLIGELFYDYHTLPLDMARLSVTLGHAYGKAELKQRLSNRLLSKGEFQMTGTSPAMQKLYRNLQKVYDSDAPVLIHGESGTGKELAALAIHQNSRRGTAPFVAVNCGSIPTHLVQSELFGHEKGAFTGARSGASRPPTAERFSWTRSAIYPWSFRSICCVSSRKRPYSASAPRNISVSMRG